MSSANVGESDHRIANGLSMIASIVRLEAMRLDQAPLSTQAVQALLADIAVRIKVLARLHRLLSSAEDLDALDCAAFIREICESAARLLDPAGRFRLAFDMAPNCPIPAQRMLALGMIVNEAVTNSVKYAHPTGVDGRIDIYCRAEADGALFLVVEDDGIGLPAHFNAKTDGGLGFRIMRSLAAQCDADLNFRSTAFGLRIQIVARTL